ncbi:triose-phosphate isomerase [Candidatus Uhrbacteria bacterium RIFOXYC2_FULL_47_19]|uniref:Triosephosphate isomerase n=1 Tax=Candidatus Uhrbacteria bacterium RIFOXYC2_FULL_47_19 TaxID=1802424 RepID=A0A1F7WFP2_9BACT|nr:MAG: triose-phosphate isomerase [Candidatus Uhrbacteria bacterium RIFOXYC2_FULL_47_19]HCC22350.1 triose-phosphate isomerase [Candidatus Uhrbacteria bacterium]
MGKKYLIANWKMQLSINESRSLAQELVERLALIKTDTSIVVCPSGPVLSQVAGVIRGSDLLLGAQNSFWEDRGAYTGEVSPANLKELGCSFCLVGHSERREYLGETDEMVGRKVAALLTQDITPIICIGETEDERDDGRREEVLVQQLSLALADAFRQPHNGQHFIVAYEPIWMIGSGQMIESEDVIASAQLIRKTLNELCTAAVADKFCTVIYGGSVDTINLSGFLSCSGIDGALVGGTSLTADNFMSLVEIASRS